MVSEKKIFQKNFQCKSMETNDPQGVANLDPWDMVGRIHVGDH